MPTFHVHITGLVQGVGFRPMICDAAGKRGLKGWVRNSAAGLDIRFNATGNIAGDFFDEIKRNPPLHAIISDSTIRQVENGHFERFEIIGSEDDRTPNVLMPPDVALCDICRADMNDAGNRRYRYPFTTCLHCGPRYSLIRNLPYDRIQTTMAELRMCPACRDEYTHPCNRRQHSQTNSCPDCAIPMHAYDRDGRMPVSGHEEIMQLMTGYLRRGEIIAVKGVGGYLLLTDATNASAITTLRNRKHRPRKPFALMYHDPAMAAKDACIGPAEYRALLGPEAPVVLCLAKKNPASGIHPELIAPGLDTLGILMPYNPLYYLLMQQMGIPLIATSANLSGSPIIYCDDDAVLRLNGLAGLIITYEREITAPQDDSVMRFSTDGQRIILRRSRGMAPCFYPDPFRSDPYPAGPLTPGAAVPAGSHSGSAGFPSHTDEHPLSDTTSPDEFFHVPSHTGSAGPDKIPHDPCQPDKAGSETHNNDRLKNPGPEILAMGADLKSAFALTGGNNLIVSQYLGDLDSYDSQCAYRQTLDHIERIYGFKPETILTDSHPGYFVTALAEELSEERNISLEKIQHHEAHFAAVLAENGLLMNDDAVLGVIWDGTGYGGDGQVWGGEIFLKNMNGFNRAGHLEYYPVLSGDKMSLEPRLAALSLLNDFPGAHSLVHPRFSSREWDYYSKVLRAGPGQLTSSMGRLFDGIASLLDICHHNTYEGEAAGLLEALARRNKSGIRDSYPVYYREGIIDWKPMMEELLTDLENGVDKDRIASKVFRGLSRLVFQISGQSGIRKLAFSGGVFQNALLTGFIMEEKPADVELYFHRQLSPNDENIGFGQLAHYIFTHSRNPVTAVENQFHQ